MRAGADDYLIKPVDPFAVQTRLVAAERVTGSAPRARRRPRRARARQCRAAMERSLTDPLTGLGNRRRMEEDLAHVHARAERHRPHLRRRSVRHRPLQALQRPLRPPRVATRLSAASRADLANDVRPGERVYRYGGEEFLLVLDDCTHSGAVIAAERLRLAVADLGVPHESRPDGPPRITLSGGVACWTPGSLLTIPEFLSKADNALYEAKSAGRNCIRFAEERVSV